MRFILWCAWRNVIYLSYGSTFQRAQDCFVKILLMFICTLKILNCLKIILYLYQNYCLIIGRILVYYSSVM